MYRIKFVLSLTALLFGSVLMTQKLHCQSISNVNKVVYKLKAPERLKNVEFSKEDIESMDQVERAFDMIECELYYSKNKSVFAIAEKPLASNENTDYLFIASLVSDKFYLDHDSQKKIRFERLEGENLNVILPYHQYNWEITTENKKISGYTCYKAICAWDDFDVRANSTTLYSSEVWFTPEIPSSFGPMGLDGLPGLVLEADYGVGGIHFYAAKIEFNVEKPKMKFDPPTVKYITEEEHQKRLIKVFENIGR